MPTNVISSFEKLKKEVKRKHLDEKKERAEALEKYFSMGGVIKIAKVKNSWPKLIYPTPLRVRSQIKEFDSLRANYFSKQKHWEKEFDNAKRYYLKQNVLKMKEPLYWKHMAKRMIDSDYRADTEVVKLPANLVADDRWKPMVKMFVNDIEYRKQLVETVQNSIVYKDDKKVGKYASTLQAFRMGVSDKRIKLMQGKVEALDANLSTFNEILKWAKET